MPMDILVVAERRLKELADTPGLIYREARRKERSSMPAKGRPRPAGTPENWLKHARSDLRLAQLAINTAVFEKADEDIWK
jgi:hypothetical protein